MGKHEITAADIMPLEDYAKVRKERRHAITELKRNRRVAVGPDATFYFECYETMWHQIHEMLYIEKGGDDQIPGELAAYNPLIPGGRELVATLMVEVDDPARRAHLLAALGGVEETVSLEFDGETIRAIAEADVERTSAAGKASSVHFLHFPFADDQARKLAVSGTRVVLAIGHPNYAHMTVLPEAVRQALAGDFD
ncbi:MAG: DUF3501 family protein [Rhodospirillales bacterium]|jgi:hypothetical protein|nr:DUF3501 family protein [Rhodospirillales bacterium]MDP6773480.1 DUF3501 family protein [Rhodospirillales bacterium]